MSEEVDDFKASMKILRWDGESVHEARDELAEEEPLEIRVNDRPVSVTMRTPGNDFELAAGFLLSEGMILGAGDIGRIAYCGKNEDANVLNVMLAPGVNVDFDRLTRHVFVSSSCGLCGKATIESVRAQFPQIESELRINAEVIAALPDKMRDAQTTFARTGGLHASAVFAADGKLVVLREDVGRHNALDKVLGYCLRKGSLPLDHHVLVVSGRSSFEIMQKALAGRIAVIAGVSAPSSLAVRFARESGQTLIGFLRGRRMNVYAHPSRVSFSQETHPC
jgi:FdhD protein